MVIDAEEALRTGGMSITGRLVDASNATLLAKADDGQDGIACIYKPIAGERPLWDFPHGTLAYREYAAYLVSSLAGFDVVPFTILRDGPFGEGAVQQWIEIDPEIDLVKLFQQDQPELRKMAIFDAVINNTDRKIGHLLPTPDGRVRGCDHGVTFHVEDKLRTVLWQWAGVNFRKEELELLNNLCQMLDESLGDQLGYLLTHDEIVAIRRRVEKLLEHGAFPHPNPEWPSIPWPPF
jgi:uncharacterized repeat protein (TIGR03843 family)